ncbi:lysophospholipid acyltransferase family protein [Sansalvadorimonas verongulae]|uniref:lysophospholipid acyltransferase family protein n=1 Tax=Sansalvadorimonas verongulae TaxID=2172824 RepID=UPI0012BBE478|nr:GNAT family N-acyltransferase [Sansalvadorimonas verongulae]MTI13727.1 lysophospholipid acyltransferase family protein [Sansalvadorimonas verongulae]
MTDSSPFHLKWKGKRGLLMKVLERMTGLRRLDRLYHQHISNQRGKAFLESAMVALDFDYQVHGAAFSSIPQEGSLLVVSNHPFGGAEGIALLDVFLKARPDVRILSNQILNALPGLKELFIGVDILSESSRQARKRANQAAIEEATQWVGNGGVLIIFPSGEVADWDWQSKATQEAPWRHTAGRILRETQTSVMPVYVDGRNSWLFYLLGRIHPLLRTTRLVHELLNKKGQTLQLYGGSIAPARTFNKLPQRNELTSALRMRSLLLDPKNQKVKTQEMAQSSTCAVAPPVKAGLLANEIRQLPSNFRLLTKGDMEVWCSDAQSIPHLLQEIGRLRELTFREVGEGTGQAVDIDDFDQHYLHLFLWNKEKQEVAGAYRIGQVDKLVAAKGVQGLYSRSLFHYDQRFLDKLGSCLEMGRSFICPEYQKSLMALQMLWKGIGCWVVQHPQYRVLFGPVSISNDYQNLSRYLMAMSLKENNFDQELATLVQPVSPLPEMKGLPWNREMLAGLGDIEQLSSLVQLVEKDRGVPVLLKQYLKLNGTFVGFNVDSEFNDALDGLIIVDLLKSEKRAISRYLGEAGYKVFCEYHAETSVSPASTVV